MELFSEAVVFAARAHDGMRRKANTIPYILHPMEAAQIAATMTDDQEILAAAVLHDTVEDAFVSAEEIEEKFGARVKMLVLSETENKREEISAEQSWQIRKQEALDLLSTCTDRSVKILYVADKLSNLRSISREYAVRGDTLWENFHQKDVKMHHWYYRSIAQATRELSDTFAWQEFDRLIDAFFLERK